MKGFRGVAYRPKRSKPYEARKRLRHEDGTSHVQGLGTFDTPQEAAEALIAFERTYVAPPRRKPGYKGSEKKPGAQPGVQYPRLEAYHKRRAGEKGQVPAKPRRTPVKPPEKPAERPINNEQQRREARLELIRRTWRGLA